MHLLPLLTLASLALGAVIRRESTVNPDKRTSSPIDFEDLARDVAHDDLVESGADEAVTKREMQVLLAEPAGTSGEGQLLVHMYEDAHWSGNDYQIRGRPDMPTTQDGSNICWVVPPVVSSIKFQGQADGCKFGCAFYETLFRCTAGDPDHTWGWYPDTRYDIQDMNAPGYPNDAIRAVKCWWQGPCWTCSGSECKANNSAAEKHEEAVVPKREETTVAKRENHAVNLYSDSYFRGVYVYINYDQVQSSYCKFIHQDFGVSSIEWIPGPQKYCAFFTSDSCDGGHPYFVSSGPSLLDLEWNQDVTTGRPWNDMIRSVRCYTFDPTHVKGKRHEVAPTALGTAPRRARAIAYAGSDHAVNLYQKHNFIGQSNWVTIGNVFAHDCINLFNDKGIGSIDFPSVLNGVYCHLHTDTLCSSGNYFTADMRIHSGLNDWEKSIQSIRCWISSDAA